MAEEHAGQRQGGFLAAPWTRIFGAFRVAIDPQKLFLAAAGILIMALGWWLLAIVFYSSRIPSWENDYRPADSKDDKVIDQAWKNFKRDRMRWNLLHKMAGPRPASVDAAIRYDEADFADSPTQYELLNAIGKGVRSVKEEAAVSADEIKIGAATYTFTADVAEDKKKLKSLGKLPITSIRFLDEPAKKIDIAGIPVTLDNVKDRDKLKSYLEGAKTLDQLRFEYTALKDGDVRREKLAALDLYEALILNAPIKPFGHLRVWPFWEDRGPNPYLLVSNRLTSDETSWFLGKQVPVLLEPLFKFLAPILYWFDPAGGLWNRIYLFFVNLWMLITWGVIGGAITRMAIVQFARNEKVGPGEALRFVRARIQSYVTAPLFPLVFLGVMAVVLFFFGLFEQIPLIGDVLVAGLFWPVVLIFGLIMAVVLIGLIGWPLMYATLSAEGSDSFDAISRSYSYVFQATWHYLWYAVVALLYGAVLMFFIGFLSSMMVYMGKWGVSNANFWQAREPSYLFMYAPTSFGWRDLLLDKSINARAEPVVLESGREVYRTRLKEEYVNTLAWYNHLGAILVSLWLCIFFMLVVGFGYSYFWAASSIIYLLMRQKVDDTEIDEIHMDDEEDDFTPPAYQPQDAKPAAAAGPSVTMVEAPTLRPTPAPTPAAPTPAAPPTTQPAASEAKPAESRAPKTMLAPAEPEDKPTADVSQAAAVEQPRPDLAKRADDDKEDDNGA